MRPTSSPVFTASLALVVCCVFNGSVPTARAQLARTTRPDLTTPAAERSIQRGLAYLARTQTREGKWPARSYPTAVTSLAGLALLQAGNTPLEGKYAVNVRRATDHILRVARRNSNGLISEPHEGRGAMHGHGFAMLFLAEVYGMGIDSTRQREIARVLRKAVELTGKSQSAAGGWLYRPDQNSDEASVTATQVHGLRACYNAGIDVSKTIIDNAEGYLDKSSNPDGGISYGIRQRGRSAPAITAAAVATLYHAGKYEHPIAKKALKYLDTKFAVNGDYIGAIRRNRNPLYTMFYMSQAMYLASEKRWNKYYPGVRDDLVKTQNSDGSWKCPYGGHYATAISLSTMLLPYAHLPIFQR